MEPKVNQSFSIQSSLIHNANTIQKNRIKYFRKSKYIPGFRAEIFKKKNVKNKNIIEFFILVITHQKCKRTRGINDNLS